MGDVVRGKFAILYLQLGSVFYPVACAKDLQLSIETEEIELAPRTSDDFREYEYARKTAKITGSGLTKVNTAPDNLYTVFDLIGFQLASQKVLVKFSIEDSDGNVVVFECNTIVKSADVGKNSSSASTHNYSLLVTGPVTMSNTPVENTNPQILVEEFVAVGGETELVLTGLGANAVILLVYIDGNSKRILLYPTGYGPNQVQWRGDNLTLYFGTALTAGQYVKVVYVDVDGAVDTSLYLDDGTGSFIEDGTGEEITSG